MSVMMLPGEAVVVQLLLFGLQHQVVQLQDLPMPPQQLMSVVTTSR